MEKQTGKRAPSCSGVLREGREVDRWRGRETSERPNTVECCGRLALALPIAGGMIRQMDDVWQTQLVPMLKEELTEELSVEQRIVSASLRCVEESQRPGVEALFAVFGCFAEDEVVPAAALGACARA